MPIHDLPLELLSEIISLSALYCPTRLPSYKHFLLDLCLVSKAWRDVAYANQALWSFIDIVFTTNPDTRKRNPSHLPLNPRLFDIVAPWLGRSGQYPKTYTIWAPRNKRGGEDDCLEKQLMSGNDLLCPLTDPALIKLLLEGPPVAKLAVTCPASNCFRNLLRHLDMGNTFQWDQVKELMVDCWEGQQHWTDPDRDTRLSMFRFFKSLTALNLAPPSKFYMRSGLRHPPTTHLPGLRILSLSCDWEGSWVAHTVSNCPHLEELSIDFMSGPTHGWLGDEDWVAWLPALSKSPSSPRYVVFPRLHTLRVRNIEVHAVARVLRFLRTPSLRYLQASFITKYKMEKDLEPNDWTDDEEEDESDDLASSTSEMGRAGEGEREGAEQADTPEHERLTMSTIRDFLHSFLTPPDQPICSTLISMEIGQTPYNDSMKGVLLALDPEEFAEISTAFPALRHFSLYRDEPAESVFIHLSRPAVREEDPGFYPPLGCLDAWKPSNWCTRSDYERRGGTWDRIPGLDVV